MTESDRMMMAAVQARQPFEYNSRVVETDGNRVDISLHGHKCASIDFSRGLVTVHGDSLKSRKSAKVFNAVLRTYTEAYAKTCHGKWDIMVPVGTQVEFTDQRLSIPISRGADGKREGFPCLLPEHPVMISQR